MVTKRKDESATRKHEKRGEKTREQRRSMHPLIEAKVPAV